MSFCFIETGERTYVAFEDGRKLCSECKDSAIWSSMDLQALCPSIQIFFEGLDLRAQHQLPFFMLNEDNNQGSDTLENHVMDMRRNLLHMVSGIYGWPRLLAGSTLVFKMMEEWLLHEGYSNLSEDVKVGICRVLSYLWLESQLALTCICCRPSKYEKKLGEFLKLQIEIDERPTYGDGFRAAYKAVQKYGLKKTLRHIRFARSFPL